MTNKLKKILYVARDDGGCGFFRCEQPAKFMTRAGLAEAKSILREPSPEDLLAADLVIMQHMGTVEASNISNFCIQHNIPYVTEFDDFVHHVSPHNDGGYHAWNPSTLYTHRAMEMSKRAFAVQVSTDQLAREYFAYNPNVFVVPNYLDRELWMNPLTKRSDGKIRIGWVGGNAHADDLKMVSLVLNKLVREYKGKVMFETMGMTKQELAGVFPMKDFPEQCPSCNYEGEIHHYPGESLQNYPMALASKGWDIGIAPVIANSFGIAKSSLKVMEYAAAGIPIVASPIPPYLQVKESGAQVSFGTGFNEWYGALKDLIDHREKRDEIARKNKEWIEKYWIQDNVFAIFEVYKQLIEQAEKIFAKKPNML